MRIQGPQPIWGGEPTQSPWMSPHIPLPGQTQTTKTLADRAETHRILLRVLRPLGSGYSPGLPPLHRRPGPVE